LVDYLTVAKYGCGKKNKNRISPRIVSSLPRPIAYTFLRHLSFCYRFSFEELELEGGVEGRLGADGGE